MRRAGPAQPLSFTFAHVLRGSRTTLSIAISVGAYGLVFGVLARQAGLSIVATMLMSTIVFAGASQFVALGLWAMPLPVVSIVLTTLIVNLRHVLMGMSLSPWLLRISRFKALGSVFFMTDESWALTTAELAQKGDDPAFLLGSGITLWIAWQTGTCAGRVLGSSIHDPSSLGLDFAFSAVFITLLVGLWRGAADVLPWIVAAAVAVAASHWLQGTWYILLGGLAGSVAGAVRRGP
ncbi:MAG: AzlC family ABC transporter permease [Chloroflexota bacterium]